MGEFTVHYNEELLGKRLNKNWLEKFGYKAAHMMTPDGVSERDWGRISNGMGDAMTEKIFMAIRRRLGDEELVEIFPFLRRPCHLKYVYKLQFERFEPLPKKLFVFAQGLPEKNGAVIAYETMNVSHGKFEGGLYRQPEDAMEVRTHPNEPLVF